MADNGDNIKRLPLVSPLMTDLVAPSTGGTTIGTRLKGRLENLIAEKTAIGYDVFSRSGSMLWKTIPSMPGGSLVPVGQYYNPFSGNTLSFFNNSNKTIYVSINGGTPFSTTMAGNLSVPYRAFAVGYLSSGNPFTFAMSAWGGAGTNFACAINENAQTAAHVAPTTTSTVGGVVYLDNTVYYMDNTGTIWGSNVGDPTTWNALNFIAPTAIPGAPVFIAQHNNHVVALKSASTEFLWDAGNPTGSPLSVVQGAQIEWGCADSGSVQDIDGQLFWLARSGQSSFFVATLKGGQHSKISTPDVDRLLDDVFVFQGFGYATFSFVFRDAGHTFYGLTFGYSGSGLGANLAYTIVYDIEQGLWYLWYSPGLTYFPYAFSANAFDGSSLMQSINSPASGLPAINPALIWELDEEVASDNGVVFQSNIYTPNYDSGTKRRKLLQRMDFTGRQSGGILQSRWSDTDYLSWSNFRSVDMNQMRPSLTNNGSFRRRAWNFRYQNQAPLKINAVELDQLLGTD